MALSTVLILALFITAMAVLLHSSATVEANDISTTDATASVYPFGFESHNSNEEEDLAGMEHGRSLHYLWHGHRHAIRYYISYAALVADRVPCPPRSGRSYYTYNCHLATGPAHPYHRGCSAITRCRGGF